MDSLSHAMLGIAVAGLSGHMPSIGDPVYIASVLGSQAPDFDLVAQVHGNMAYLRQHRFFSHSLPGIGLLALAIAGGLSLYFGSTIFVQALFWAFAGGLSHILIDYFNTHGVALLWPFKRDRKSTPLLNVFDPIMLLLMVIPYVYSLPMRLVSLATFGAISSYLILRYLLRRRASAWIKEHFSNHTIIKMWIMPSLRHLFYWDFVIETTDRVFNGRRGILHPTISISADLQKPKGFSTLTQKAQQTGLGQFFNLFTPYSFFEEQAENDLVRVRIYDLRYYANQQFIHSATIVFDQQETPNECYLHSMGRTLKIAV
ncbi:MAG: Protein of unknown function transrane [Firmicutes bacterium]|nr:Protein of unknown function transrane [Bacillota bacterium]